MPKGPKGPSDAQIVYLQSLLRKGVSLGDVGRNYNLKDREDAPREPSALEGWILEVLCCNPKGSRAFLRILST